MSAKPLCIIHPAFGEVPKNLRDKLSRAGYCVVLGDPQHITVVRPEAVLPDGELMSIMGEAISEATREVGPRTLLGAKLSQALAGKKS